MKLNSGAAADVLRTFIQEDRVEARIWRGRVQNVTYTLAVASFATSAFLIGKAPHLGAGQLRWITLLIDLSFVAVMLIFFWRTHKDLVSLRKGQKIRQDILNGLNEGETKDINPFAFVEAEPDIKDSDLYWVVGLSLAVVLIKMLVLAIFAGSFVAAQ